LQDDYYRYDKGSHSLTGNRSGNRFRLGDPIRVSVARVDIDRRELDFRLVARKKRPERVEKPGRSKVAATKKRGKRAASHDGEVGPKKRGRRRG
jgi:ribonuclease R